VLPNAPKPATHRPTFARWCQQHAALTLKIQRILIHRKREISLSLFTRTHDESMTASFTMSISNRICLERPTQRHDTMDNPSECNDSTHQGHLGLPVPLTTNIVTTSRLRITSTLRRHHVRFCPLPVPQAYLPHIRSTHITIIHHQYQCHARSTRTPPHAHTAQTSYHIKTTSRRHCVSQAQYHNKDFLRPP